MENPLKNLFGAPQPKTPEQAELMINDAIDKVFDNLGVNMAGIRSAYFDAIKLNQVQKLGLTKNRIVNMLKDTAYASTSAVDDALYGGVQETLKLVDQEIERLRQDHQNDPQT